MVFSVPSCEYWDSTTLLPGLLIYKSFPFYNSSVTLHTILRFVVCGTESIVNIHQSASISYKPSSHKFREAYLFCNWRQRTFVLTFPASPGTLSFVCIATEHSFGTSLGFGSLDSLNIMQLPLTQCTTAFPSLRQMSLRTFFVVYMICQTLKKFYTFPSLLLWFVSLQCRKFYFSGLCFPALN
jgi:hypothetical protein